MKQEQETRHPATTFKPSPAASRAAKAQSVDLTGDDMMDDEEEDEFDDSIRKVSSIRA